MQLAAFCFANKQFFCIIMLLTRNAPQNKMYLMKQTHFRKQVSLYNCFEVVLLF